MEDEDGDTCTPFWLQSRRNNSYFRRTSSLGSRATTVAIQSFIAGVAAILIVFFIIPPLYSSVSTFRPHLVRKSWDYLNFFLVLFAVICGFISRNTSNEEIRQDSSKNNETSYIPFPNSPARSGTTPRDWIHDQKVYKRFSRLRSSSYPDLSLREFESDQRWRFYDDTHVNECRYEDSDPIYSNQSYKDSQEEVKPLEVVDPTYIGGDGGGKGKSHIGGLESENVEVAATKSDEVVEELPTTAALPPSPPPLSKPKKKKTKRVYQDVAPMEEKKERDDFISTYTMTPPPTNVYEKSTKKEKKKGGGTKDFLIALRRKKKKQRQQSVDGLDLLFGTDPSYSYSKSPPPPPPPPPFFQGLFSSKKGKSKKIYSNPPPPPPPPPPERRFESRASRKPTVESSRTSKPNPTPTRVTQFTGSESPLMPIPPPPPPPPFKMPTWKFVKRGDYVRMASNISISSDEHCDSDVAQASDGKVAGGGLFCPSPDVDTKADDFIARFRAGLKLEKLNSVKRGRSNLGPEPGSDQPGD